MGGLSQKEKRKTDALFDESRATRHRATYYNVYHEYGIEDDYTVAARDQLGFGGFGSVCLAVHKDTKVERACKMVRKSDLENISQFEKEVEYQKMLDHPNICRLYDVYADKKCYHDLLWQVFKQFDMEKYDTGKTG